MTPMHRKRAIGVFVWMQWSMQTIDDCAASGLRGSFSPSSLMVLKKRAPPPSSPLHKPSFFCFPHCTAYLSPPGEATQQSLPAADSKDHDEHLILFNDTTSSNPEDEEEEETRSPARKQ
ncbi:unnamed protein product [Pleuronectes platessa]|uniref:Uncharacterized protein n=1 Tax=Pleuronectes platessa TaxID=8262 RepID=A0A9N7Z1P4_PLEPL|nr:unnamed protein product [Pleuronectes platessa]